MNTNILETTILFSFTSGVSPTLSQKIWGHLRGNVCNMGIYGRIAPFPKVNL